VYRILSRTICLHKGYTV